MSAIAKKQMDYQPVPIPEIPPICEIIQFPYVEVKVEVKQPSMQCMKTDLLDWRFDRY